jgi:hypothetical protein
MVYLSDFQSESVSWTISVAEISQQRRLKKIQSGHQCNQSCRSSWFVSFHCSVSELVRRAVGWIIGRWVRYNCSTDALIVHMSEEAYCNKTKEGLYWLKVRVVVVLCHWLQLSGVTRYEKSAALMSSRSKTQWMLFTTLFQFYDRTITQWHVPRSFFFLIKLRSFIQQLHILKFFREGCCSSARLFFNAHVCPTQQLSAAVLHSIVSRWSHLTHAVSEKLKNQVTQATLLEGTTSIDIHYWQ